MVMRYKLVRRYQLSIFKSYMILLSFIYQLT